MRKFSTNPLQKHRAVTINNSCMYLKLLLRRYTERFFSKNREHKSRKKGKRKEKKKQKKMERGKNGREKLSIIVRVSEINATWERLQESGSKFVSICKWREELLVFVYVLKYGLLLYVSNIYIIVSSITSLMVEQFYAIKCYQHTTILSGYQN